MGCGLEMPPRAPGAAVRSSAGLAPEAPPRLEWLDPWRIGVAAVICSCLPIVGWVAVFVGHWLGKGHVTALTGLIWLAGLALGIVAIVRGERVLGIVAIAICVLQLVCAAVWFAFWALAIFLLTF